MAVPPEGVLGAARPRLPAEPARGPGAVARPTPCWSPSGLAPGSPSPAG